MKYRSFARIFTSSHMAFATRIRNSGARFSKNLRTNLRKT